MDRTQSGTGCALRTLTPPSLALRSHRANPRCRGHLQGSRWDAEGWGELESALLQATDELLEDTMLSDEVWSTLSGNLSTEQITDLIFTVGQYNLMAVALNSLGIQREPGIPGFEGESNDIRASKESAPDIAG